jgi:hypothetical protein
MVDLQPVVQTNLRNFTDVLGFPVAYSRGMTIQDYVLLKAAETTVAAGGTHFGLINSADASRVGSYTTPGTAQTSVYGNMAFTTFTPGSTTTFVKPGENAYIRVLKLAPGQQVQGAINAAEIIQFIGPRVQRDEKS